MSMLNLPTTSSVELYDQSTGEWMQQMLETVRFVESEQKLLYKVRKGLSKGLDDTECLGLQNEIAWVKGQGVSAAPEDVISGSASSIGSDSDDIYQYLSLPDDSPRGTPSLAQSTCALNRPPVTPASEDVPMSSYSTTLTLTGHGYEEAGCVRDCPGHMLKLTGNNKTYTTDASDRGTKEGEAPPDFFACLPHPPPVRPHPPLRRWPFDFTVSEVAHGFRRMRQYKSLFDHNIRREAFQHVFGCRFVPHEFRRHYKTWATAKKGVKKRFEDDKTAMWGEFEKAAGDPQFDEPLPAPTPPCRSTYQPAVTLSAMSRLLIPKPVFVKPKVNMAYYRTY
jgi:hypothetical protein